jgi:hypothetical protein
MNQHGINKIASMANLIGKGVSKTISLAVRNPIKTLAGVGAGYVISKTIPDNLPQLYRDIDMERKRHIMNEHTELLRSINDNVHSQRDVNKSVPRQRILKQPLS